MKTVGLRELKNRLSEYVREVRSGEGVPDDRWGNRRRARAAGPARTDEALPLDWSHSRRVGA
jgi:hypothetical protein